MLQDLHDLAAEGHHPTYEHVKEHPDMASARIYDNRFGSLSAALRAAGLPAFEQGVAVEDWRS